MLSQEEYERLSYKDKAIYDACFLKFKNNWSTCQMVKELNISRSTAFRWLTEYLPYIDKDLYEQVQTQLKENRRRSFEVSEDNVRTIQTSK